MAVMAAEVTAEGETAAVARVAAVTVAVAKAEEAQEVEVKAAEVTVEGAMVVEVMVVVARVGAQMVGETAAIRMRPDEPTRCYKQTATMVHCRRIPFRFGRH